MFFDIQIKSMYHKIHTTETQDKVVGVAKIQFIVSNQVPIIIDQLPPPHHLSQI